jgi:hypothetical protein
MVVAFDVITRIFDLLLCPFKGLAPIWAVAFLALLSAAFILWVYKGVSNQNAIRRLKKRIQGHFLGIYLFRDDPVQIFVSLGNVLSGSALYLCHSLIPLAVAIVPIALVCVQLQLRYGYRELRRGERVLVSAECVPGAPAVTLEASGGLAIETPAVRIAGGREVDWRVLVEGDGEQRLVFRAGGFAVEKDLSGQTSCGRLYPLMEQPTVMSSLLFPGQKPIAKESPLLAVRVAYPHSSVRLIGLSMHWSIAYFVLAIVFGMLLKRLFGVEF